MDQPTGPLQHRPVCLLDSRCRTRRSAPRSSRQYIAAVDLSTQRSLAGEIQTLLRNQTPIIYGHFYDHLTATAANVTGVYPTASEVSS